MLSRRDLSRKSSNSPIPIAIKSSTGNQWLSVLINEETGGGWSKKQMRINLGKSLYNVYNSQDVFKTSWKLFKQFFYFDLIFHCFFINYCYCFTNQPKMENTAYMVAIFNDCLYFIYASIEFFSLNRINKRQYLFDIFLILPFWNIPDKLRGLDAYEKPTFVFLRCWSSFVRLYKIMGPWEKVSVLPLVFLIPLYFLTLLHGLSCIWMQIAPNSWKESLLLAGFNPSSHYDWYLQCMYFNGNLVFTSGAIFEKLWYQQVFICATCIVGVFFLAFYAANLFAIFTVRNKQLLKLAEACEAVLRNGEMDLPRRTHEQYVMENFRNVWRFRKGVTQCDLISEVNWCVLRDILFEINFPAVKSLSCFKNLPQAFLRQICCVIRLEFYNDGEFLRERHETVTKMIYVTSGTVEEFGDDNNTVISTFGPDSCFGEVSLYGLITSKCSLRASGYVTTQVLYRKDLLHQISTCPAQCLWILRTLKNRIQDARKRKTIHYFAKQPMPRGSIGSTLYKDVKPLPYNRFIQDDSFLHIAWKMFITVVALIIAISYPYFISFEHKFPMIFSIVANSLEIFLVLDLILLLMTPLKPRNQQKLKQIVVEKLSTVSFYLDLLAAFYFEIFSLVFLRGEAFQRWFHILKFNRLIKFYKVINIFRNLEGLFWKLLWIRIAKYAVLCSFTVFWMASLLYLTACLNPICYPNSWFKLSMIDEYSNHSFASLTDCPLEYSLYKALSFYVNFEIALPKRSIEMILFVIFGILGYFMMITMMADLCSIIYIRCKRKNQFLNELKTLSKMCYKCKIPNRLKKRMMNYYILQWEFNSFYHFSQHEQFLSTYAKTQVAISERIALLQKVEILKEMPGKFVKSLAQRSKVYILPPNDIVTYSGNMNKEMFVIKSGCCIYKTSEEEGGFKVLTSMSSIGFCSLFFNLPERNLVRTLTYCILVSVDGSALQESLVAFPEIAALVHEMYLDVLFFASPEALIQMSESTYRPRKSSDNKRLVSYGGFLKNKSFVNALSHCKENKEGYSDSFKEESIESLKYFLMPCTILPWGQFFFFWSICRAFTALLFGFLGPMNFIFYPNVFLFYLGIFLDIFNYLDVYLCLHLCYPGEKQQTIFHPIKTFYDRFLSGFLMEIFMVLPYELIVFLINGKLTGFNYCICRMIRFVMVYKTFVIIKTMKKTPTISKFPFQIIKSILYTLLVLNFFGCFLVYEACNLPSDLNADFNFEGFEIKNQSWIARSKYGKLITTKTELFVTGINWCCQLMFGMNFGEFTVQGGSNLDLTIAIILIGILLQGYICVSLIPYCVANNQKSLKLANFQFKLKHIMKFIDSPQVEEQFKKKIEENALHYWLRTKEINYTDLFSRFHTSLLQDTLCFFYEDSLRKTCLFKDIDRSFLRIVAMIAKPQYFLEGQIIVNVNDVVDDFYIILEGTIKISLHLVNYKLMQGGVFGYFNKDFSSLMTISAICLTNVDVLCIKSSDFFNILKNHRMFNVQLEKLRSEYKDFMQNQVESEENLANEAICRSRIISRGNSKCQRLISNPDFLSNQDYLFAAFAFIQAIIFTTTFAFKTTKLLYFGIPIDALFAIKFALNFYNPYYNNRGELITEFSQTKKKYLKKRLNFSLDLIAVAASTVPNLDFLVVRVFTLWNCKYLLNREEHVNQNIIIRKLYLLILRSFLFIHSASCFWCYLILNIKEKPPSFNLNDNQELYIKSLTLITNILTATSTINLEIQSNVLNSIMIFLVILFKFSKIFFVAKFINIIFLKLSPRIKFQYELKQFTNYMDSITVNHFQMKKLRTYLSHLWKDEFGKKYPELMFDLPFTIVNEIKTELYKRLLQESYIFQGTQDAFLRNVCTLLQRSVHCKGDVIVHDGQIEQCMYFIREGEIEIVSSNSDNTETVHDVLHKNEMFGLAQGLFGNNIPHQFKFKARTNAEILFLQWDTWEHLLQFFPQSKAVISERLQNVEI